MNWQLSVKVILLLICRVLSLNYLDDRTDVIPNHFFVFCLCVAFGFCLVVFLLSFFLFVFPKNVKYELRKN